MKTLIIVAHPNVEDSTTQQFLKESSLSLTEVVIHLLTDSSIDIEKEQQQLIQFDRIIFQFPMYWYSAPYLLKKWLDEVFTYQFAKNELQKKELGLVVNLGVAEKNFNSGMPEKFTLAELFKPYEALANKCGMVFLPVFPIPVLSYMDEKKKRKLLMDYQYYLTSKNKMNFDDKQEWVIDRLESYVKRMQDGTLMTILDIMKENRETLDSISLLLEEMR